MIRPTSTRGNVQLKHIKTMTSEPHVDAERDRAQESSPRISNLPEDEASPSPPISLFVAGRDLEGMCMGILMNKRLNGEVGKRISGGSEKSGPRKSNYPFLFPAGRCSRMCPGASR
jgi:hypothetical protein